MAEWELGVTGSGKTTLLNVLSSFIPDGERIVTIEDAAELQLRQEHVLTLESRPPNLEGEGEITIRNLLRICDRHLAGRAVPESETMGTFLSRMPSLASLCRT